MLLKLMAAAATCLGQLSSFSSYTLKWAAQRLSGLHCRLTPPGSRVQILPDPACLGEVCMFSIAPDLLQIQLPCMFLDNVLGGLSSHSLKSTCIVG